MSNNERKDLMNLPRRMRNWTLNVGNCAPDFMYGLETTFTRSGREANGVRSFEEI